MNLKHQLESDFFPFITKPGRYIGNELGSICKSDPALIRMVLSYPDKYELGMSHLGLHIIYNLVNKLDFAACERVFAPDLDAEARLRELGLPLFSIESATPINDFDLFGFSLSYELCFTNMVNMLDMARIPMLSEDRDESHMFICGGGPICFNPEPIADFLDFFFVGDVEESLAEILNVIRWRKESGREQTLKKLAQLKGVYVPSFYRPVYGENGHFIALEKSEPSAPDKVQACISEEIKPEYYPKQPIVPFEEIIHDRISVEIMRGCGHACRFCQAGVIYRPKRDRPVEAIVQQAVTDLENTGYDELTLLSLSSSDYQKLDELVFALLNRLQNKHIKISLPSLRPTMKSFELAKRISVYDRSSLTFALEGGSERIRQVINKQISIDEYYQVVKAAFESGWKLIKLYFMIGLPTETEKDILDIVDVLKRTEQIARQACRGANINVTISPFSPKPHTPWQWEKQYTVEQVREINNLLKRSYRGRGVQIKTRNAELSHLEGVFSRGDRRLSKVILRAFELGARFDGWSEHFDYSLWENAFIDTSIDTTEYSRSREPGEPLPWDHIDKGISKDWLLRERERACQVSENPEPIGPGFKFADLVTPGSDPVEQILAPTRTEQKSFGRKPKRQVATTELTVPRSKLRLSWSKGEQVRFHAHLATTRVFERAIRRAMIPVVYSQGYHPRQRLSFGPPLSFGCISQCEYLDIQLERPFEQQMIDLLNCKLPTGFRVLQGKSVFGKASSLTSLINLARYEILLGDSPVITQTMIDDLLSRESIIATRRRKEKEKEVEIRKVIIAVDKRNREGKEYLFMELALGNLGFTKPEEVLATGFGFSEEDILRLKICRTELLVFKNGERFTPFEVE